jgi:hypothetical protein
MPSSPPCFRHTGGRQRVRAAEWHSIASNNHEALRFDAQSLKVHGHMVTVWTRTVFTPPKEGQGFTVGSMDVEWELDCRNRMFAQRNTNLFSDGEGENLIASSGPDQGQNFIEAPPDSHADILIKRVCKGRG